MVSLKLSGFFLAACLLFTGCAHQDEANAPVPITLEILPAGSKNLDGSDTIEERLIRALDPSGFEGVAVFSPETKTFSSIDFRELRPGEENRIDAAWPWASVTKQVLAVAIMQQVEHGMLSLDAPANAYLPEISGEHASPTLRQLLQHRSGLRNPDDSPSDATGLPSFYSNGPSGLAWCVADSNEPTDQWRYNNCDYIVLGAILERVTGKPLEALLEGRIGRPSGWRGTSFLREGSAREYAGRDALYTNRIARYGASASLVGPIEDILRFDRALLDGELLGEEALAILWQSDPGLGYMALGQWVFEATLEGCDAPVTIVERRGGIGKYQVRNIILPERDFAMALVTDQPAFDFGEIWTGSGAMHDVLSKAVCS